MEILRTIKISYVVYVLLKDVFLSECLCVHSGPRFLQVTSLFELLLPVIADARYGTVFVEVTVLTFERQRCRGASRPLSHQLNVVPLRQF